LWKRRATTRSWFKANTLCAHVLRVCWAAVQERGGECGDDRHEHAGVHCVYHRGTFPVVVPRGVASGVLLHRLGYSLTIVIWHTHTARVNGKTLHSPLVETSHFIHSASLHSHTLRLGMRHTLRCLCCSRVPPGLSETVKGAHAAHLRYLVDHFSVLDGCQDSFHLTLTPPYRAARHSTLFHMPCPEAWHLPCF
jgi:hypothetical protein